MNAPDSAGFVPEATVCSILSREDGQQFTVINRTHGVYRIHHPQDGEAFKLSQIPWKRDYADVGEYDPAYTRRSGIERRKEFVFDAKQIAEDVCKQINDNGPGEGSFFGVFVCAGKEPTKQELGNAKERLHRYFMQTVAAADSQWSANPRHDLVSGVAKRAARYLNLDAADHEWMTSYQQTMPCPACGERVRPGVAICKSCHAILDRKKAEEYGLIEKEPETVEVGAKPKTK